MTRDAAGLITAVDPAMLDLLGWRPEQLVGQPSTRFIHPEDQASAVAAWVDMITAPGSSRVWRGRYRTAVGAWQWVETVNCLGEVDQLVHSTMRAVTVEQVSVEEELRARTQLLSLLSDALPVGLVQIDTAGRVSFTNDRLHAIVGTSSSATLAAQLANVVGEDLDDLDAALAAVLAHQPVDDIELRLDIGGVPRVCLLSLRALTDNDGVVTGAIGCISDVTDSVQLRRELEIRASVDQLTSCFNRAATLELLGSTLRAREAEASLGTAVVFIDLDRFKPVNDVFGHAVGDRLLIDAADRLHAATRGSDLVGRIGGDEFLVICPGVDSPAAAVEIADRIAAALTAEIDVGVGVVALRASVGVAWTADELDADGFIAQADAAMYQSKRDETSTVTLFRRAS